MSSDLYFNNIKFISAKQAGLISGYSPDYIGQLCRSNKLVCQRVGKSWYIKEDSLTDYVKFVNEQLKINRETQSAILKKSLSSVAVEEVLVDVPVIIKEKVDTKKRPISVSVKKQSATKTILFKPVKKVYPKVSPSSSTVSFQKKPSNIAKIKEFASKKKENALSSFYVH
ncbi:MAG: hypothetical protein ACYC19_11880 [Acidimicrobiales bacterium]